MKYMCILYENFWIFCPFYGSLYWELFCLLQFFISPLYYQVWCMINIAWFILQPVKANCGRNQRSGVDLSTEILLTSGECYFRKCEHHNLYKRVVSLYPMLLYSELFKCLQQPIRMGITRQTFTDTNGTLSFTFTQLFKMCFKM